MSDFASVDDRWSLNGLRTLVLENEHLRAVILVDHGANTYQLVSKASDVDLLYKRPRIQPRKPVFGQPSSLWIGGIDELIPTGFASTYQGQHFPALGEVWCQPWDYEVLDRSHDEVSVHLWCYTIMSALLVERWVILRREERMLRQRHRVTNLSDQPFDVLWGVQHLTLDTGGGGRIDLPAENVLMENYGSKFFEQEAPSYRWPFRAGKGGARVDMRLWPPQEPETDMGQTLGRRVHYAMVKEGWLAFTRSDTNDGIGIVFPVNTFPVVWLYLVWKYRDLNTVALQPWTGYPAKLHEASEKGVCRRLAGQESVECDLKLVLFSGLSEVTGIDAEGHVVGSPGT